MVELDLGAQGRGIPSDSSTGHITPVLVTCGRHDKRVSLARAANSSFRRQSRLWSTKPRSDQKSIFIPIATDGTVIFYAGRQHCPRDFLNGLSLEQRGRLLTLTCREVELALPVFLDFDAVATALESAFPVFSEIKYCDSLERRLQSLEAHLRLLRKIGLQGPTLTHQLVEEASYQTERAVRSKNGLDQFFALSPPSPYQEVFKLREERADRVIVALDFNSMYGSCMEGLFPEPKSLRYRYHHDEELKRGGLSAGIYRVILSGPNSEFFCKYHPLRFTLLGNRFAFRIEKNQAIEALLLDSELLYYAKFFERVQIIESITSNKSIPHPLARQAKFLYDQRLRARVARQELKERVFKLQVAALHSVTNRRRYQSKHFKTPDSLLKYVSDQFQIDFPATMSTQEKLERLGRFRFIGMRFSSRGIRARILNYSADDALHALSSRIFANARLKIVRLLERIHACTDVDVCYVNTDCVHVSVKRSSLASFLDSLSGDLSGEMGGLRVQCVADEGYWFEPGRYWLIRDGQVVQFANKVFNHPGAADKFNRRRRVRAAYRGDFVSFSVDKYLSIERAFSYSKRLLAPEIDTQDYKRYTYEEVCSLEVAGDSIEHEILRSKGVKIELFNRIATDEVSFRLALSRN